MKTVPTEQSLFFEAHQRDTAEARAAYLEAACGANDSLRKRVEALLQAADRAGDFLEHPPIEDSAYSRLNPNTPGNL